MALARAVLRLGPRRWLFLARVALTAALIEAAVRTVRLPRTARLAGVRLNLDGGPAAAGPVPAGWSVLTTGERDRCDLALRVLDRGPFDATCLRRSLLLGHLLRHRGPVLRVGVAKRDGVVAAHAWLEVDGASLDTDDGTYLTLAPLRWTGTTGTTGAAA